MPRPRSFVPADAVRAARDRFWSHGYEATSLADLEAATGLNRSSLYQAFGGKRALFELAVDSYLTEIAWPRLAVLQVPGADRAAVAAYFEAMAGALSGGLAGRGCLIVNTITELGPHDPDAHRVGTQYRARIREAFRAALATSSPAGAERRADLLVGLLIGALVTARLSPDTAAALAHATAVELSAGDGRM